MKSFAFLVLFLAGFQVAIMAQTAHSNTGGLNWFTDLTKALEASDASQKPIFGFFTGSDWCGWCKKLQADVFAKEAFVSWAQKNVILLELDFPRRKQLPEELAQQNQALAQAFKIQGYPTIWIFYAVEEKDNPNLSLSALGSLGYPQGAMVGKEELKFLEDANRVLANGKK